MRKFARKFANPAVAQAFKAYPAGLRAKLLAPRALVFETASRTDGVGKLTETLKWGQPSYLTEESGSGSTVRIDALRRGDGYAVYFHCQSGLVDKFREIYPGQFSFEGKRAIVFGAGQRIPKRALGHCIGLALTHQLNRKRR